MRKFAGSIFVSFFMAVSPLFSQEEKHYLLNSNSWNEIRGKIDTADICMSLYVFENNDIKGNYFNVKDDSKRFLQGKKINDKIYLTEINNGKPVSTFTFTTYTDKLPSLQGSWKSVSRSDSIKIEFDLTDSMHGEYGNRYGDGFFGTVEEIESYMKKVKKAIAENDKEWIANNTTYPFKDYKNKKQLLKHYDKIFHKKFKEEVRRSPAMNMLCNYNGIQFGSHLYRMALITIMNSLGSTKEKYGFTITSIMN